MHVPGAGEDLDFDSLNFGNVNENDETPLLRSDKVKDAPSSLEMKDFDVR